MRVILPTLSLTSETSPPVRDFAPKTRPAKSTPTTTAPTPLNPKPASSSQTLDYKRLLVSVIIARQGHLTARLTKSARQAFLLMPMASHSMTSSLPNQAFLQP